MRTYQEALADAFRGFSSDMTEENIQSRIRGVEQSREMPDRWLGHGPHATPSCPFSRSNAHAG
jgi:hypothetical protein